VRENRVPPRVVVFLWPAIDGLLRLIYHIKPLRADGGGIICVNLHCYKGPTRVLGDGCQVRSGDTVIELHLNNAWFRSRRNLNLGASQSPKEFLGCFAQDLRFLAHQMNGAMLGNATALHGITLLDAAAIRLGFQVDELPDSWWKKGTRFYMAGLMQAYHLRPGHATKSKRKAWELREVWLSKTALLARYGQECP